MAASLAPSAPPSLNARGGALDFRQLSLTVEGCCWHRMGQLSLTVEGLLMALPFVPRCNYNVVAHHDGVASCYLTQSSPSWPRAGHPCGDAAVSLPAGFVCCQERNSDAVGAHRTGREPSILVGIPRCRYQLALSKPKPLPQLGEIGLTNLAVFAEQP